LKILTVCSGLDFINFTRRATIEAIHKINPELDILMFNSILNLGRAKILSPHIKFYNYHFWIVEKLRKFKIFPAIEYFLRYIKWKLFFSRYEVIFFIDPNQYYLLPYLNKKHKLLYLLRDPSVLLDPRNFQKELPIIKRANAILGISENLCTYYFEKYYGFIPENVHLWPNTVDMKLWDYNRWENFIISKSRPLIGLAGNITYVIDIELLIYIIKNLQEYDFEIAGKLELNETEKIAISQLLSLPNVKHLGFIYYDLFPATVINWDVGIVAAKTNHEFALYLNNNKQYQYLALGKPFVSYRFNSDYRQFEDLVFIASDREDFVEKIKMALNKTKEKNITEKAIGIASKQSSESRAKQFIEIAKNL
jgi:hypothetical protein